MSSNASVFGFPNEVLALVFSSLPLDDLAEVSLLCRACRALAFPYLYQKFNISRDSHLAGLASRVASDNGQGPLSVVVHLRELYLDTCTSHQEDVITEESLVHLEILVPRLVKLEHLLWDFGFISDAKYLRLFQTQSSTLASVELTISPRLSAESEHYTSFFDFSNLSHISIKLPGITFTPFTQDIEYLPPLTRLLNSSPGLMSLTLVNSPFSPISVVNIVSSLGSTCTFPALRVFRFHWVSEEFYPEVDNSDWNGFFTLPGRQSHPLRSFFLRHQGIEDLALGWCPDKSYEGIIDPEDIVQLFPSLKRYEGPAFLCNAITKSDIAPNLEALAVVDMTFLGQADWLDAMAGDLRKMPKLRSLNIRAHGLDDILDPFVLDDFILAAPGIELLECRMVVNDFVSVLVSLSHAPKLRKLVVDGQSWVASALDQEYEENPALSDWKNVDSRVAKRCHLL